MIGQLHSVVIAVPLCVRRLPGEGGDLRVHTEPVGHPFCPGWDA